MWMQIIERHRGTLMHCISCKKVNVFVGQHICQLVLQIIGKVSKKSIWNDLLWPSSHPGFSACLLSWTVSSIFSLSLNLLNLLFIFSQLFFNQTFKAGSTQATRLTAARQIGDIAKSHPQDLTSLLKKVLIFLTFCSPCICCNMLSYSCTVFIVCQLC